MNLNEELEPTGETQETGELTFAEIYQSILEKELFQSRFPQNILPQPDSG
jgi:hypothetical protein